MRAYVEGLYDEYERMAIMAMMNRQAYHAKKLKQNDLFKRPTYEAMAKQKADRQADKKEKITEWMSRIKQFQNADIGT